MAPWPEVNAPDSLAAWLRLLESRQGQAIMLGLERVALLRERLGLYPACPIIMVGGTNGKGSTCAYLESVLAAAGYRVGCYTSPHLLRYNERVRVDGAEATDAELCAAFAAVEAARADTPLTYFEQGTLAALWLFQRAGVEVMVLEVGLGGRLDAVNAWEADCAVVTSVDLDHQQFLGDTREAIGFEKAGIYRAGRPAICGDPAPPLSLRRHAEAIGASWLSLNESIQVKVEDAGWTCRVEGRSFPALPRLGLPGRHQYANAACAIAALDSLRARLPVAVNALRRGLAVARPPGRFHVVGRQPLRILDVAHNPHAARALADNLAELPPGGRVLVVFAMLADKDVEGVIAPLLSRVDHWHVAGLGGPRGLAGAELRARLRAMGADASLHDDVARAWRHACRQAGPADTILVFGSFHTVAEVLADTTGGHCSTHG